MIPVKLLVLFVLLFLCNVCSAQFEKDYQPKKTYSEENKNLIKLVQKQLDNELKTIQSYRAQKIFKSNTQYLIKQIKQNSFLNDDTLQVYVQGVFNKLLLANEIPTNGKTFFVHKNPDINAICFGEGTFYVTVGLLRKIENEGQLAFTIAHELAHYQLNHVRKKVIQMAEVNEKKQVNKEVERILNGTATVESLEKLRELVYVKNKYSRSAELEADSLGFILYKNAGYRQESALSLIDRLDFTDYSKQHLGKKLFLPFHFKRFPFNESWLNNRLGVYNKKPTKAFVFDVDSIQTHPDFKIRKTKLKTFMDTTMVDNIMVDTSSIKLVIKTSEFEAIESAYISHRLDVALFLALELKSIYPKNGFINIMIIKIFIDLFNAHENQTLGFFVPKFTGGYHEELRMVNNFLNNVSKKELIEIAFHFMNQRTNFNQNNQEHYYLLWKIARMSKRFSFQEKILSAYLEKFPEGKYKDEMT